MENKKKKTVHSEQSGDEIISNVGDSKVVVTKDAICVSAGSIEIK